MAIETANYISELNQSNPNGTTDYVSEGDDHIKLIKTTLKNSFPNIDGTVDFSTDELNDLRDNLTHSGTTFNAHSNGITGVIAKDSNSAVEPRSYNDTRYLRVGEIQTADIRLANDKAITAQSLSSVEVDLLSLTATDEVTIGMGNRVVNLQTTFNKIKLGGTYLYDVIYPIGSLYENYSVATNPFTLFGFGTWTSLGAGRVVIGVGTTTDTAGESKTFAAAATGGEFNHVLTEAEGPVHKHVGNTYLPTDITGTPALFYGYVQDSASQSDAYSVIVNSTTAHLDTENAGSGTKHNNIQPYVTVYRWVRTA
jgi:hypothetical protein